LIIVAIHEHNREDLLHEGRNMPWRGECVIDGAKVILGFRSQGQASLFCDVDPVFQFNRQRELRRAYFNGTRYRAENGRLIALTRDSRGGRVEFDAQAIDSTLNATLVESLRSWLSAVRMAAETGAWRVEGEPIESFQTRLRLWLADLGDPPIVAAAPNA
jgi:hypothetical protein